mgnify:CR=1 FL=1
MEYQQALQIISQVCAEYKGTLQEHQNIQQALSTIMQANNPKQDNSDEGLQVHTNVNADE